MTSKPKLYLATNGFPWGLGEKTFIIPELPYLLEKFDVTIIAKVTEELLLQKELQTDLDDKINIIRYVMHPLDFKEIVFGTLKAIGSPVMIKEGMRIISEKKNIKRRILESLSFYLHAQKYKEWLEKNNIIDKESKTVFYSYWSMYFQMSGLMLKKKYPLLRVITRAHGMDLYNERYSGGRQPFKKEMDKKTDRILFISEYGKKYYLNNFSSMQNEERYAVCKLGIVGMPCEQKKDSFDKKIRIVSCSNVIALKRIDIIIKALAQIDDIEIQWIHFGSGDKMNELQKLAKNILKANIEFCFQGHVCGEQIKEYYENNWIDCFITTSSTEGIPVSIMEAMSASIPIIATNVGGIPEMIDGNGILLSENPTPEEVEKAIRSICNMKENQINKMRARSFEIWKRDYDIQNCAKQVTEIIEKVCEE